MARYRLRDSTVRWTFTFAASGKKSSRIAENPRYLKTVRGAGYRFEAPEVTNRIFFKLLAHSPS